MKVKELIEKLKSVDPELDVLVWVNDNYIHRVSGQYQIVAAEYMESFEASDRRFEINIEIN